MFGIRNQVDYIFLNCICVDNPEETRRLNLKIINLKKSGLFLIGLILLTACSLSSIQDSGETITGSGNVVTENRPVSGFDGVSHTGIGRVIITQGEEESLTIEADDNILE